MKMNYDPVGERAIQSFLGLALDLLVTSLGSLMKTKR